MKSFMNAQSKQTRQTDKHARNFKSIAVHAKKDDDQPSIRRERERERDVKE